MKIKYSVPLRSYLSLCLLAAWACAADNAKYGFSDRHGICPFKVYGDTDPELAASLEKAFLDLWKGKSILAVPSEAVGIALADVERRTEGLSESETMEQVMETLNLGGITRGTVRKMGDRYRVGLRMYMRITGKGICATASSSATGKNPEELDAAFMTAFSKAYGDCVKRAGAFVDEMKGGGTAAASATPPGVAATSTFGEMSWRDPVTHVRGTYTGETAGGKPHGYGTLAYVTGESYRGNFADGVQSGKGIHSWTDGKTYDGQWQAGSPRGQGTMTEPDGTKIIGQFEGVTVAGIGQAVRPDGVKYEGPFVDGKPHGTGTLTFPNTGSWTGPFLAGAQHGSGVFTSLSGETEIWEYHNGSFVIEEAEGQYYKEPANKDLDDMIGTALAIQGLASTLNRVAATPGNRPFVGKGSPPLNSFDRNNKPNAKYYRWAYGGN